MMKLTRYFIFLFLLIYKCCFVEKKVLICSILGLENTATFIRNIELHGFAVVDMDGKIRVRCLEIEKPFCGFVYASIQLMDLH